MSIQKDMRDGDEAEQRLLAIFRDAGLIGAKNIDPKTRKFWDLEASSVKLTDFTVEVKNDRYAIKSGNIAVEIFNPKSLKDSGLSATKADLWAVMVGQEFWIAKTEKLREYVDKNKPLRIIHGAGDGNATILLFKSDDILPSVFTRIDELSKKDVNKVLLTLLDIKNV